MPDSTLMDMEDAYLLPTYARLPIALVRGKGSYVWDSDGNKYLDFYGGHCVTGLGHCPEPVVDAVRAQVGELMFYSNVVYSPVRAKAAKLLGDLAPKGMANTFFVSSGTEANEVALKLARTVTKKPAVVGMRGGFHGRTLGSIAATGIDKFRAPYEDVLAPSYFVDFGDIGALEEILDANDDVAAVILEPIQSMSGVQTAPDAYFHSLRELCTAHGCLLIFDEIQTGVGRTGAFTFAERVGVSPDVITLAKSLGSGVPVGAVLTSDAVAATVGTGDHGTTFGGGMVAMAAAVATLEMLVDGGWMARPPQIFAAVEEGLADHVVAVRGEGCLMGVELDGPIAPLQKALRERGVLVGGSSDPNTMRLMPPLTTSDADVDLFLTSFLGVLEELSVSGDA